MMTLRWNPDENVTPKDKKEGPSRVRSLTSLLKISRSGSNTSTPKDDLKKESSSKQKRRGDSKHRSSSSSTDSAAAPTTDKNNKKTSNGRKSLSHGADDVLPPSRSRRNNGLSSSLHSSTNSTKRNSYVSKEGIPPRSKSFSGFGKLREQFVFDPAPTQHYARRSSAVNRSINSREAIALARRSTASSRRQMGSSPSSYSSSFANSRSSGPRASIIGLKPSKQHQGTGAFRR